jgi:hypothetical protein
MNPTTQLRKERQAQRKADRLKAVADRRHEAEVQARIKRQMNVNYYLIDYCWYKTTRHFGNFEKWYEEYFKVGMNKIQGIATRETFGDNPPVAFDVDRVGY